MRCTCCGNEIRQNERYCNNCGQNNESYIEPRPTEETPIYNHYQSPTYYQPPAQPNLNNSYYQAPTQAYKQQSGLETAIKVFMVVGTVLLGILTCFVGLIWCIPMTASYFKKVKNDEYIGTGFKICTILFVSPIAGIMMLCDNDQSSSYTYYQPTQQANSGYQPAYQSNYQVPVYESGALGVCAIVFGALGGWIGLLLSIIGLCTYKRPENRSKCWIGLGLCIGWFVLGLLYVLLEFAYI